MLVVYLAGYFAWSLIGAIALRRWALIPLFPALLVVDWVQRVNFVVGDRCRTHGGDDV